jgi:hypothetical protein
LDAPDDTGITEACSEFDEWDHLIEDLEDLVVFDRDWEMDEMMDDGPEVSGRIRAELGIDDEYFMALPPDPTTADVARARACLKDLCKAG